MTDDEFEPKLGRIGSKRERSYLQRVLQSAAREGARYAKSGGRFSGSRIGRGAGVGRVLGSRDRLAAYRARRVIVQARIVKLAGKGLANARAHLRYIQRDGVTRDGAPGELFDRDQEKVSGKAFIDRADGDRHQFRFIVSPEDSEQYQDLKPFVRRLMERMEKDLGTKLDWVAANHYNTGHPHAHIVVRGKDERGKDLIIAREYITQGMRERAAEILSLDFGPRSDLEVLGKFHNEMGQERLTSIDRDLLRTADHERVVAAVATKAYEQTLRAGRLQKLKRLGLAMEIVPGRWRLDEHLQSTLRQMGERGDIIRTMHRELARVKIERGISDYAIYDPADRSAGRLVGRMVGQGMSDELYERRYLIVDGVDGRTHYVDVGLAEPHMLPPDSGIVAVDPLRASPKPSDRTIAEVAAANEGYYSSTLHALHDPSASPEFVLSHIRRLEALRRAGVELERRARGTWTIAPDHLARVERYEEMQRRLRPVRIEMLSPVGLERQIGVEGATWLDHELTASSVDTLQDAGFGRDVRDALNRRRQWLVAQSFAQERDGRTVFPSGMVADLQCRELAAEGGRLAREQGLAYRSAARGDHIEGIYKQRVDLASGRFAVIENGHDLTLVPWRPVIENSIGREVSGIMRGDGVSWTLGRQRSGPSIG